MSHTTTHAKAKKDIKKDRLLVYLNSMWFQTNTPQKINTSYYTVTFLKILTPSHK
jgi:hypothetical protein